MCYQAERVKNRKPATLQMTKGHCFHADTTNKCFTIQPFTRTDTLHLPLFSKRCNVSLWDFRKPTAAFDNPAYCATAMPQTKQCQTGINTGTHCTPEEEAPYIERASQYIERASHPQEPQQTKHIPRRRNGVRLHVPPTMVTANITTHALPS